MIGKSFLSKFSNEAIVAGWAGLDLRIASYFRQTQEATLNIKQKEKRKKRDCLNVAQPETCKLKTVNPMSQSLNQIAIVVKDYDEAIKFYTEKLGFILYEDKVMSETKRWVVVGPKDSACKLLLAKAVGEEQSSRIGNQTGGRVFLFLYTTDFENEYNFMKSNGVEFVRERTEEDWGTVAVFKDLYGNLWDFIEMKK